MKIRPQQIRRRNNMLSELCEMVTDVLARNGLSTKKARDEAEELCFQLHRRWRGITFTFPIKDDLAMKMLKLHILERYDGSNAEVLAREFNITEDWIYAVLREHHKKRHGNQVSMDFGDATSE